MKIKIRKTTFDKVAAIKKPPRILPVKPNGILRRIVRAVSKSDLKKAGFTCDKSELDKIPVNCPCLILMNHSSFIDFEIASAVLYPRKYNIVATLDGLVGKERLMRALGCMPTRKFITDTTIVKDIVYAVKTLGTSVLMYPEASYSFDGTTTLLPESIGKLIKLVGVPVVMISTFGAFLRDPLYNNLQIRSVNVSASVRVIASEQDVKEKSASQLQSDVEKCFSRDYFKEQQEGGISIAEPFRADHLDRVLYKCPHCYAEGETVGLGTVLECKNCGKKYTLTEDGFMRAENGETEFPHIPDWYAWQRECVAREIECGTYSMRTAVDIYVLRDYKSIYSVGSGELTHDGNGFKLVSDDGLLEFSQPVSRSYSLYSDFYWYEVGDIISIGDSEMLYYCVPKSHDVSVAKARIAAEELYKAFQNHRKENK